VTQLETKRKNPNPNLPEIRCAVSGLEFREQQPEGGKMVRTISGYAVKWDTDSVVMRDYFGDEFVEQIAKGAFDESLRDKTIKALWSHDRTKVLGSTATRTLRLTADDTGLAFEVDLPDNTDGRDAWESISRGDVDGVSFGFRASKEKWSSEKREGKSPLYRRSVLNADLAEISPTPFPAYPDSEVSVRSLDDYRESLKAAARAEAKRKLSLELELLG
jgi:HK97 family phage prohead protease